MEDVTDIDEEMEDQVKNVVKGLALGRGQFLLAIAWVTKESKLNHIKFSWLLRGDKTFRTNAEKHPFLFGWNEQIHQWQCVVACAHPDQPSEWVFLCVRSECFVSPKQPGKLDVI